MISLFGYGKIMRSWSKKLAPCNIYDDKFDCISKDEFGNNLLPICEFRSEDSTLEIVSPGIPPTWELISYAKNLISEYDYFYKDNNIFSIWISGTNGKTTTTQMITHLLKNDGAYSGGNIGIPLCDIPMNAKILVLESSSFMLYYTKYAYPNIYALLPITPDHLSWHRDFNEYVDSKLKPISLMKSGKVIIPMDFKNHRFLKDFCGEVYFYEDVEDLAMIFNLDLNKLKFKGPFLLDSALALSVEVLAKNTRSYELMNDFSIDSHKIEEFRDAQNRLFVDDSKATNIDAVQQALKIYKNHFIFLILGGDNKGVSLEPLIKTLIGYKVSVFAIGVATNHIYSLCKEFGVDCQNSETLQNAIDSIDKQFTRNDNKSNEAICLLSPACASLDQFQSYKHRGEVFKKYILNLSKN